MDADEYSMNDIFDFLEISASPNRTVFDFKTQMAVGDDGEEFFKKQYSSLNPIKSKILHYDFDITGGFTVELKTDDYPMSKTPNFFMEEISDVKSGKLGGPFRAENDGVTYFVYQFLRDKTVFWFKTNDLMDKLRKLIASGRYDEKTIKNKTWSSTGYAIPRAELESVIYRKDVFP